MEKVFVIGHKNPDTDSVTSAISLAYLKRELGLNAEPRILGPINKETEYILKRFNFPVPELLNDVKVQVEDVPYKRNLMISENASIYEAYSYMVENGITGLPVVKDKRKFNGYVSLKEIATDLIRGDFDYLDTSYENLLKVLEGKEIIKYDEEINGQIIAATYSSETFMKKIDLKENSIVIVGERKNIIDYCIKNQAKLIILVGNQKMNSTEIKFAKKNKVNVISTPKNAFEVSKIIGLSNHIKTIVRNESPVVFKPSDYLSDFFEISNKLKHTNYPILDKNNNCNGMLRLLDVNSYKRKQVILVDHNDNKQSVDGLNEASILEIVDHHAIGNLTTNTPISFRNMSVGSSNTIIYHLFKESRIKIPKNIAALMLSGILSDTLLFKSPTTTELDKIVAGELSKITSLNIDEYGMEMLKAGSSLDNLTTEDIVYYDYKDFEINDHKFGIGQVITLDKENIFNKEEEIITFLNEECSKKHFELMALFVTDILRGGSYLFYAEQSKNILALAYNIVDINQGIFLKGIISRKKQIVPYVMNEFENME